MESYLDTAENALETDPRSILQDAELRKMINELGGYMSNGLWRHDFECDERGELPSDLKRGVLSEDALYNLICEIDELVKGTDFWTADLI